MRLRQTGFPVLLLSCLLALAPIAFARPAGAADLAAHRALYALTLQSARGDVTAASGSMAYEVTDACDAWATRQRLTMTVTNRDGQDIEMISDYTTWESKDGLKLRFRMRQTTDQAVTSDLAGDASLQRAGGPGEVHYTTPEDSTKKLPEGTLFPMAHTALILAGAAQGRKFITVPLFDGTGPDGAQDTSIAITSWTVPSAKIPAGDTPAGDARAAARPGGKWPALAKLASGRVHVAFFDRTAAAQEPDYEVGMRYWDNGVADDLAMDFGDFVMTGRLTELAISPHAC